MLFYEIKPGLSININNIQYIEKLDGDKYMITMDDGNVYYTSKYGYRAITGAYDIRSLAPVEGFESHFKTEEEGEFTIPVHFFGSNDNGDVRAIDIGVRSAEFIDEFSGFEGISKNGERIVDE